jgi:hypothetical protein
LTARAAVSDNPRTMKTFLIVLLTAALLAAACFTRPDEQSFLDHLARSAVARGAGGSGSPRDATNFRKAMAEMEAEAFGETCDFKDRLLWVDVQRDGRTIYTGAFAHWFRFAGEEGKPAVAKSVVAKPAAPKAAEARPAAARKPARKHPVAAAPLN